MLHLVLLLVAAFLPAGKPLPLPSEEGITVEILTEPSPPHLGASAGAARRDVGRSAAVPVDQEEEEELPPPSPAKPASDRQPLVAARTLFSSRTLDDPRSRGARTALRQLGTEDRISQLCNIEAMEQVQRLTGDYRPDFVVAYAKADLKLAGLTLEADGGAIRSRQHWYDVTFICEVTPDLETVTAFQFSLGAEIPEAEWEEYALPAGEVSD
ncbi:DUF930 domain-containing protein [Pseudorhizobium pelagicum]|uniref:DUF930 domain-containing protein n=1 Tax=Pseudorhizobium pelagicum TaxID=1509405 RepID=UPI002989A703